MYKKIIITLSALVVIGAFALQFTVANLYRPEANVVSPADNNSISGSDNQLSAPDQLPEASATASILTASTVGTLKQLFFDSLSELGEAMRAAKEKALSALENSKSANAASAEKTAQSASQSAPAASAQSAPAQAATTAQSATIAQAAPAYVRAAAIPMYTGVSSDIYNVLSNVISASKADPASTEIKQMAVNNSAVSSKLAGSYLHRYFERTFAPYLMNYNHGNSLYTDASGENIYYCPSVIVAMLNENARVEKTISELANSFAADSEYAAVSNVYSYMVSNFSYNVNNAYLTDLLSAKTGSCNAQSYFFMAVLRRLGIKCGYISGTYNGLRHAWNQVTLQNGTVYYFDFAVGNYFMSSLPSANYQTSSVAYIDVLYR